MDSSVTITGLHNPQVNLDANASAYNRFRFRLLQSRSGGQTMQIDELALWSEGERTALGEGIVNVTSGSGSEFTLEENGTRLSNMNVSMVVVELPQPIRVSGFSFVTGLSEDDDPAAFTLEAAFDAQPWSLLVQLSGYQSPRARLAQSDMVLIHRGTAAYDIGIPSGPAVGNYTLCWASRIDGLFNVDAGTLLLTGLNGLQDNWCFAGTECTLGPVAGMGLSGLDQVVAVPHFES